MTLTLQLTPTQLARLQEDASRAGVDPAALLLRRAGYTDAAEASTEETYNWLREAERFRQWADSHARKDPGLSLQDMSRESIYGEHG